MILDSSAVVAILRDEPDAPALAAAIDAGPTMAMSAAAYLETSIVITPQLHPPLDELVNDIPVTVVPFDADLARLARDAYARFGRSSGSPARLNFGDCCSYALAKARDEPLLFKGDDFTHTDITPAI
ncbi:MAG: type II toxin-antitoxin system VapC family toxin [Nocardioides sp.]